MKKIKYLLQMYDGLWSFPLAIGLFWASGVFLPLLFGYSVGVYDMAFFQPFFLSVAIVVGATNASIFGLMFTFRGVYRFLYGHKKTDGTINNKSKELWKELSPVWQFGFAFGLFAFFAYLIVSVYLKLI